MYPILFQNSYFIIPTWHAFILLSAVICYNLLLSIGVNRGFSPIFLNRLYLLVYITAYIGARGLSIITDYPTKIGISEFFNQLLHFGGLTFYGGFLLSFISVIFFCLFKKERLFKVLDLCFPIGLIALGIGRLGCFFNGDDYGIEIPQSYWWTVTFPYHDYPVPRVPVQLMESSLSFILATLLLKPKIIKTSGLTTSFGCMGYGVIRFCLEFLRGDEDRGFFLKTHLSTSQGISIILFSLGTVFFLNMIRLKGIKT